MGMIQWWNYKRFRLFLPERKEDFREPAEGVEMLYSFRKLDIFILSQYAKNLLLVQHVIVHCSGRTCF